jgi:hypothetical protein
VQSVAGVTKAVGGEGVPTKGKNARQFTFKKPRKSTKVIVCAGDVHDEETIQIYHQSGNTKYLNYM